MPAARRLRRALHAQGGGEQSVIGAAGLDDTAIDALVAGIGDNPRALVNLARTLLLPRGHEARARALCARALAATPDDAELRALAAGILGHGIGTWYFTMVQDRRRHALYAEAFGRLVRSGQLVLDIGAGTGLFAMMAARAGAEHVVACERHAPVADAAARIVAANGLAAAVSIAARGSQELEVGRDLPRRADLLVWDNLANNLLGAGALATIEDAKRRLLAPGAVILPGRVEVCVRLVEHLRPADLRMGEVEGFDLSPFDALTASNRLIKEDAFIVRSDAATLFDFDFQSDAPHPDATAAATVTASGGRVDGILQWLRFHLAPGIVYDTGDPGTRAFGMQFHLVEPRAVQPGTRVVIRGSHDRERTWFWLDAPAPPPSVAG